MTDQTRPVGWRELPLGAMLFRITHAVWGAFNLAGLAWIWLAAIRRRRDRYVYGSMALLLAEGAALVVGRGDCPFGPFQARLGDPVPMFELVLPPRAAKAAVPILTVVSLAAMGLLFLRPPEGQRGHEKAGARGWTPASRRDIQDEFRAPDGSR